MEEEHPCKNCPWYEKGFCIANVIMMEKVNCI